MEMTTQHMRRLQVAPVIAAYIATNYGVAAGAAAG
jgi:hypothetical protein